MNRGLLLTISLLATGCPRPSAELEPVLPEAPAKQPEAAKLDPIRQFVVGWGMATLTEGGVLRYRGSAEVEAWLAEQRGEIEDIWVGGHQICVRTSNGISCKTPYEVTRIELPSEALVIDLEWDEESLCFATSDGALWCRFDSELPQQKDFPISSVVDIEMVRRSGCALARDGSAHCWSVTPRGEAVMIKGWPAPEPGFTTTRDIAVGSDYSCMLDRDGKPRCRDDSLSSHTAKLGSPRKYAAIEGMPPLIEIDGGRRHVCGRSEAGEVWCWGDNEYGQLGDGTTQSLEVPTPVLVGSFAKLDHLALGHSHGCVLADGEVQCWGWLLDTPSDPGPTEIPGILARQLDIAETTACARVDSGWKCWGGPAHGLGGATEASRIIDVPRDEQFHEGCRFGSGRLRCDDGDEVWLDLNGVIDVVRDSDPLCALRHERVECHDYLGDSPTIIRVPASVSLHGSIDEGCVLTKTGEVHCWLDDGKAEKIDLPGKQVVVSVGFTGACALDEAGEVRCWAIDEPVVAAGVSDIVELHGGYDFGCARDRAGALMCWGSYLTDPESEDPTPEQPLPMNLPAPVAEFGIGWEYGCARLDDGRVFCWGSEIFGERARVSKEFVTRPKPVRWIEGQE